MANFLMQCLHGKIANSQRHRNATIQALNTPKRSDLLW